MTYFCPFCKTEMLHQPDNQRITTNNRLRAKVGDTFKCNCSIQEKDSNNSLCRLNSWKLEEDGWYHLGSTDGVSLVRTFASSPELEWEKKIKETEIPQFGFNPSRRW
jgi:hypothetical protein